MSSTPLPEAPIRGESAVSGLGAGTVAIVSEPEAVAAASPCNRDPGGDVAAMFDHARSALAADVARRDGEVADILRGQLALLDDPALRDAVEAASVAGLSLASAVTEAAAVLRERLQASDLERIRQRAGDVDDLAARLTSAVTGQDPSAVVPDGAGPFVLVARDLLPSQTARLDADRVAAIVLEGSGPTAHAAIIARALGIPLVTGVTDARRRLADHTCALVDASRGEVWPDPDAALSAWVATARPREAASTGAPVRRVALAGGAIELAVNVGALVEAERAAGLGARAVGLLRSELLAFAGLRTREQYADVLRRIGRAIDGPIVFRLLDVGGDKPLDGVTVAGEANPMLGARGIRLWDRAAPVFLTQLGAVADVMDEVDIRISVPMVTGPAEVVAVRERWGEVSTSPAPPIGIMVETPAAVLLAEPLARVSDFFSIGTNDLTQYLLAADRGNPAVGDLVEVTHPAVLRAVGEVARAGRAAGIPVAVCGQAAADPQAQRLLIGLGVTELSVPADALQATAQALAGASLETLQGEARVASGGFVATAEQEPPPGRFVVTNPDGLHVRPASRLADIAAQHDVRIVIRTAAGEGEASSVFSVLALGIDTGHEVDVEVHGERADTVWPLVRAVLAGQAS